jgi:hypothetical protein
MDMKKKLYTIYNTFSATPWGTSSLKSERLQFAKLTTSANIQRTYKPNPKANHLYKYENNLQITIDFQYEELKCRPFTITFLVTPWRKIYTKCEILQVDELTNFANIQITTYKESMRQKPNWLEK